MCNPISIIMSADSAWTPQTDGWVHSHDVIRRAAHLPGGEWGDRYARVEVTPPKGFRDQVTNEVLAVDDTWTVVLDEQRAPSWWADDRPAQEARARDIAARWLRSFPPHLVPGHRAIGGDYSTLTGGYGSTLTGGDRSTLTGGDRSTLTGGDGSTLTGGDYSTLTGGDGSTLTGGDGSTLTSGDGSTLTGGDGSTLTSGYRSTLTGGDRSTLTWRIWDGQRYRLHTRYVGECGIEAGVAYTWRNGQAVKVER